MTYKEYLQSDDWKRKRDYRRKIDGRCAICGSPLDLNVHHLTYDNVPHEEMTDLVTLCRFHHMEIEKMKTKPWYDSFHILNHMLAAQFCKENEHLDYSAGGPKDYCQIKVIQKDLFPYMKNHGANLNYLTGTNDVQAYFRNKRYGIILDYIEHGYPMSETVKRVRFSYNMIRKVYEDPIKAKLIMNGEDIYKREAQQMSIFEMFKED